MLKEFPKRPIMTDPPDLEEQWIKYATAILEVREATKSQLVVALQGLRIYSLAKPGKARHLVGEINKRLDERKK